MSVAWSPFDLSAKNAIWTFERERSAYLVFGLLHEHVAVLTATQVLLIEAIESRVGQPIAHADDVVVQSLVLRAVEFLRATRFALAGGMCVGAALTCRIALESAIAAAVSGRSAAAMMWFRTTQHRPASVRGRVYREVPELRVHLEALVRELNQYSHSSRITLSERALLVGSESSARPLMATRVSLDDAVVRVAVTCVHAAMWIADLCALALDQRVDEQASRRLDRGAAAIARFGERLREEYWATDPPVPRVGVRIESARPRMPSEVTQRFKTEPDFPALGRIVRVQQRDRARAAEICRIFGRPLLVLGDAEAYMLNLFETAPARDPGPTFEGTGVRLAILAIELARCAHYHLQPNWAMPALTAARASLEAAATACLVAHEASEAALFWKRDHNGGFRRAVGRLLESGLVTADEARRAGMLYAELSELLHADAAASFAERGWVDEEHLVIQSLIGFETNARLPAAIDLVLRATASTADLVTRTAEPLVVPEFAERIQMARAELHVRVRDGRADLDAIALAIREES